MSGAADMHATPIVDMEELVADLRRGIAYASRAGLLQDRSILDVARAWEHAGPGPEGEPPDPYALIGARNKLSQVIAPITFADLSAGRNPFEARNQKIAERLQLALTFFTLLVLALIGFYMQALHREQSAITNLQEVQSLRPVEKLHALRKMAQWEDPLAKPPTALYDEYHQRVNELQAIKERIQAVYAQAVEATSIPILPLASVFDSSSAGPNPAAEGAAGSARAIKVGNTIPESPPGAQAAQSPEVTDVCATDSSGQLVLARESLDPEWMRAAMLDSLDDFCFQVRVISPGAENFSPVNYIAPLRDKAALRAEWILPFLYGLLGSAVFLMRSIANVRTPSIDGLPVLMRLSLGGVAGIVIGWFSAATSSPVQGASSLSVPLVLAFLTGYGIDILFSILDRLSRAVAEAAGHAKEAPALAPSGHR